MYSSCDFFSDVCEAAQRQLGATIPDGDDNIQECADAVLSAIADAQTERRELLAVLQEFVQYVSPGDDVPLAAMLADAKAAIAKAEGQS